MPLQLGNLQQTLGETGIRRLALACNLLLLGWIGWLITEPVLDWLERDKDAQTAAAPEKQPASTALPPRDRKQYDIAGWHLFGEPSAQPAKVSPAKTNAPETRLNLELSGVYLDDQSEYSRAIISEKGRQQAHYRIGERLPGNAVLDEIHEEYVLLLRNGRYERLMLPENTAAQGGIVAASPPSGQSARQIANRTTILQGSPAPPSPLLKLRPVVRKGVFLGMSVRGGSVEGQQLLEKTNIELKPGDVITAINGIEIRSAAAGMALLEDYTTPERLELMIKRGEETIPVILDPEATE
jgi:general secretion pathway protein C